ncbi:MAG: helix-turn-helix transcriptional regulator [Rhizobacter sp.]|nr:helix-turn-helix transcriptional regulator [Chlorobiales bacterium]
MALPKKILSRQKEITALFFEALEKHIADILSGKAKESYHIKEFARILFIHPTHLSNTIKLQTGKSPCDFLEARLVEEAKRLLSESTLSIADIATKLTFKEATNFTKFFKRFAGMTPKQYRAQFIDS